jgi:hypothetical protein
MRVVKEIIAREIMDEFILIPVGELTATLSGVISLNETATFVWKELLSGCNKMQIIKAMLSSYKAEPNVIADDICSLLNAFNQLGIVEDVALDLSDKCLSKQNLDVSGTKGYIKPELKYENYVMSNNIASNCSVLSDDLGMDSEDDWGSIFEGFCYTNGTDGVNVFNS